MFLRNVAVACITALMASAALPAAAETNGATCDAMNVRIYFDHGSNVMSPMAMETLNAAARSMEGCAHAELRVAVEASDPRGMRRAEAVRAAAANQGWDAMSVETRMVTRVAAYATSPDFVAITMSPMPLPAPTTMPSAPYVGA